VKVTPSTECFAEFRWLISYFCRFSFRLTRLNLEAANTVAKLRAILVSKAEIVREMTESSQHSVGWYRWVICALLFFATTINYVDRTVLGVLEPHLKQEIGWTATQYGDINSAFNLAYAIGFLFAGWMMDRIGTRWGYSISLTVWSLAAAAHAFAGSVWGFAAARFALGIGESGNFPAAIRTVAEWFPKKERAFATGIFNAGSNVGAILAPALVPILFAVWGWKAAFIATGLAGLVWVFFWWPLYRPPREHPKVSPEELAYIESDPPDPAVKIPWLELLPHRQTQAFAIGKFLTDAVWWFYLFWFAKFMNEQFGVDIKTIGLPMITVYLLADVGSVAGGWQSSWLLGRGWSANAARKTAMFTCALCVVPVVAAPLVGNKWIAVLLIGMAAAAHQGFSANLFTLTSDMFPRRAVGSVVGIGGFCGAIGGVLMNLSAGRLRDMTGNYFAMFAIAASAYLTALLIIHLLVPKLEPVKLWGQPDAAS
jgi:ACS family hexuronate transporter-like MFS transporter